jgi:hypothetical protein
VCGAVIAAGTVAVGNHEMEAIHREVGMERKGEIQRGLLTDVDPPADGWVMVAGPAALDEAVEAVLLDPVRRWDRP